MGHMNNSVHNINSSFYNNSMEMPDGYNNLGMMGLNGLNQNPLAQMGHMNHNMANANPQLMFQNNPLLLAQMGYGQNFSGMDENDMMNSHQYRLLNMH